MAEEEILKNEYFLNLNKHNELSNHEILIKFDKLPNIKKLYGSDFVKALVAMVKHSNGKNKLYLKLIIRVTSDAEEQYAMLTIVWKAIGLRHSKSHKYNKIQQWELEKIKQYYQQGYSIYKIAKMLNRHPSTIYYALKRLGLK